MGLLLHLFFKSAISNRDATDSVGAQLKEASSEHDSLKEELDRAQETLQVLKVERDHLREDKEVIEASLTIIEVSLAIAKAIAKALWAKVEQEREWKERAMATYKASADDFQ